MGNDIDLRHTGDLAPVPAGGLAPSVQGDRLTQIDHLGNNRAVAPQQRQQQGTPAPSWFGMPTPPGTTVELVDQMIGEMSAIYIGDFSRLKHPQKWINASVAYMSASYGEPVHPEPKRHSYNLHELTGDVLAENWANQMSRVGASQKFISDSIWWLGEFARRVNAGNGAGSPRTAPIQRKFQPGDEARFEKDAQRCETALRNSWGHSYSSNLAIVQEWLDKQPKEVQVHFSQPTTNALSGLNDPELILMLFTKATDSEIPKAASNIHKEIAAIEAIMKHERKRYLADNNLQMRLRALYQARDGG